MGKGKGERKTRDFRCLPVFGIRGAETSSLSRAPAREPGRTEHASKAAGKSDSGERARTQSASALRAGDGDRGAQ